MSRAAFLLKLGTATLVMACVLISLGVWQLHRLHWKEDLLHKIATRSGAAPIPVPPRPAWAAMQPASYQYRHVEATGRYDNDSESLILRASPDGPGYHVITPFHLAEGGTVLVDRGFVPLARRAASSRKDGQFEGSVTITGLLREPEPRNLFTPADDEKTGTFYTRDPSAIARFDQLHDAAPFSIDLDAATPVPGGLPQPVAIAPNLPNNHLSYALTWFGLAAGLIAVSIAYAWSHLYRRDSLTEQAVGRKTTATLVTSRRQT